MNYQHDDSPPNIAIFVDYENIDIGVREANYPDFNIQLVLERLLNIGNIIIKRAYADWGFKNDCEKANKAKSTMHHASFEMIEIPHVSSSSNSPTNIHLVVDALDLSYTKKHVDIFCLITGNSDFSPLVSKLRENNKKVIGVGVKASTSKRLIENCDEYILYDDLVRAQQQKSTASHKGPQKAAQPTEQERVSEPTPPSTLTAPKETAELPPTPPASTPISVKFTKKSENTPLPANKRNTNQYQPDLKNQSSSLNHRDTGTKEEAIEHILDAVEAIFSDREGSVHGSHVKQIVKRKIPYFNENYYGYPNFNAIIEDCIERNYLIAEKEMPSGNYVIYEFGTQA